MLKRHNESLLQNSMRESLRAEDLEPNIISPASQTAEIKLTEVSLKKVGEVIKAAQVPKMWYLTSSTSAGPSRRALGKCDRVKGEDDQLVEVCR